MNPIKQVKNRAGGRRAEALHKNLEERIVSGTLKPGIRLDETTLAKQFGVSPTPVREALLRLAVRGLVPLRPRQGAFVTALAIHELRQLFELMADMEALCAQYAARRITPAERMNLKLIALCLCQRSRADGRGCLLRH